MNLAGAPLQYIRDVWQGILNEIRRADLENFKKGQHIRLARGEIIYIRQPDGTEVPLVIDDDGNWVTPGFAASDTTDEDVAVLEAELAEVRQQLLALQTGQLQPITEQAEFSPVLETEWTPATERPFWSQIP